jgi:hypothetical protein
MANPVQKINGFLMNLSLLLLPFPLPILLWPHMPLCIYLIPPDLEPPAAVPPMANLLASHSAPPRHRWLFLLGSVPATPLPMVDPTVLLTMMLLHLLDISHHVRAIVTT